MVLSAYAWSCCGDDKKATVLASSAVHGLLQFTDLNNRWPPFSTYHVEPNPRNLVKASKTSGSTEVRQPTSLLRVRAQRRTCRREGVSAARYRSPTRVVLHTQYVARSPSSRQSLSLAIICDLLLTSLRRSATVMMIARSTISRCTRSQRRTSPSCKGSQRYTQRHRTTVTYVYLHL